MKKNGKVEPPLTKLLGSVHAVVECLTIEGLQVVPHRSHSIGNLIMTVFCILININKYTEYLLHSLKNRVHWFR